MAVTEMLSSAIFWIWDLSYYGYVILFVSVVIGIIAYFYTSNTLNPSTSSEHAECSPKRRISAIREENEDTAAENVPRPHTLLENGAVPVKRMRKRDWIKKAYRSLMQADNSPSRNTPSDDSSQDSLDGSSGHSRDRANRKREMRRRHSTALQFAKDFVRGKSGYFRQTSDQLRDALPRPPLEFFEPSDLPEIPQNLSPEIFYVIHNLRMLELPAEWKLDPRDIAVKSYAKDDVIVRPGDPDDSIYVPLTGSCVVYITHQEQGKEVVVKHIGQGSSFFSLLSMLDVLMQSESILRTVSLKAAEPCRVAKYQISSFIASYQQNPQAWIRPIQIVVTRLLHVTMTTLHHYMGLSSELMKPRENRFEDRARHNSGQSMKLTQANRPKFSRAMSTVETTLNGDQPACGGKEKSERSWLSFLPLPSGKGSKDPPDMKAIARKWFAEAVGMGPSGEKHFEGRISIETYAEGSILIEQGSEEEHLYLLLSGCLKLMQDSVLDDDNPDEEDSDRWIDTLLPREIVGGLQMLTQEPSFYTVRAGSQVTVAVIDKNSFNELLDEFPKIYLPVAHSVLRRLSPFVRGVDFALDWVLVDSGQAVYRAGDQADSLYVVLSGRLRSVEKKTVIEEFGRGDMLGMMEVLQHRPRHTTVLAVRFSQLARVPEGLMNFIKMQFPQVGFRLVQLLGQYYSSFNRRAPFVPAAMRTTFDSSGATGDPMSHIKNLHTIAVVPATPEVPLVAFTCELYHALSANLRVLRLSSQKVAAHLDPGVLEKQADFRLMHWLNVQEDTYPLVIYECDHTATNWTRRCLRQADAILVVALGTKKPPKQAFMEEHMSMNVDGIRTNKELILLWPEDTISPTGTYEWLKGSYFSGHHHIRAPDRMFRWSEKQTRKRKSGNNSDLKPPITEAEVIDYYEQNVFWEKVDYRSDFARLARILTGNAIGLVLGGGGARGAAHVGVIRAMREAGLPVDIVGGTSIGSLVGGLFADSTDVALEERARSWFNVMCSLWRKVWDLTYAHSAMFTGAGFNKTVQDVFGDRDIEDLWIPYFCISTDISTSEMRVHRSGPLWAYCRASMSLAGYLPPLCDPQDGHLLLDGGYVNNLPADVMRSMGAKCVLAVDVGSATETDLYNYGDSLSGAWVLLRKLNPWAETGRILNMEEIQSRLAFVSCVRQLEMVKKAPYCHYLRPPVEPFMTLEFQKFDKILEVGYAYGRQVVHELLMTNANLRSALGDHANMLTRRQSKKLKLGLADRSVTSSFTDLAAQMSKIPRVRSTRRQLSLTALDNLDDEDLYLCDSSEGEYGLSSDYNDASESEEDPPRLNTPRPIE